MMYPDVREKWVAALTSGRYEQIRGQLRFRDAFCCLGVLCDLHAQETGNDWQRGGTYLGQERMPSLEVLAWAGLTSHEAHRLSALNDGLRHNRVAENFDTIAVVIRETL